MSPEIAERSFEEAIECGLLQPVPAACPGDVTAVLAGLHGWFGLRDVGVSEAEQVATKTVTDVRCNRRHAGGRGDRWPSV